MGKGVGPGHVAFRSYFLLAEKEAREFLANHKAMLPCGQGVTKTIYPFTFCVSLSQSRPQSQEEFALCFFRILCVQMHVNEAKFERNSSPEYYRMPYIGNTNHTS